MKPTLKTARTHPASGENRREYWYFDCEGPVGREQWLWRRVAPDGTVLSQSKPFKYYLDVRSDAEQHGFTGAALFGKPVRADEQY
jgi:hypothetical protein